MIPERHQRATRRHRWPYALGGALILVVALASAWGFLFLPNWRPPLREGERYGIDVSAHQKHVDWPKVADDGVDFAYVKTSEGGDFVDRRFDENWRGAGDAGLDRGAYHFFSLCTPGVVQARNFLAVASPDPDALAPAVDLELAGTCSRRPDAAIVDAELDAFLRVVEDEWSAKVVLYVGDDFEARYGVRRRLDRLLWHPRTNYLHTSVTLRDIHPTRASSSTPFPHAHVDGVDGGVDLNVARPRNL